jgi:hypothetical protein
LKRLSDFVSTDKWVICLPKCHVSFKVYTELWTEFFIYHCRLSDMQINCELISEGSLCEYIISFFFYDVFNLIWPYPCTKHKELQQCVSSAFFPFSNGQDGGTHSAFWDMAHTNFLCFHILAVDKRPWIKTEACK